MAKYPFLGGVFPHPVNINYHQLYCDKQQKRLDGAGGAYWSLYHGFVNC